jgi:hypothetical protein
MQKPLILNEILFRRHYQEQNKYLKTKLKHVKPIVNSDCPKSFFILKNKYHKNNLCTYIIK